MRSARERGESDVYHVVTRGVGRQIIFEDDVDRRRYLELLRRETERQTASLLAWCLMDNHVHVLLLEELEELSRSIQRIGSAYATYFNKRHDRVGHLFQGRFGSEPVDTDEYLLTVVRYIHQNPMQAGSAHTCDAYRWSSYRAYALGEDDGLTSTDLLLDICGGPDEFVRYHECGPDDTAPCLDECRGGRRRFRTEDDARLAAVAALGDVRLEEVASLPRARRDDALMTLRETGLSVRQVERLTGVSRGIVSRLPL